MTVTEPDRPATERAVRTRPRLKQRYRHEIAGSLREQFGYRNPMQVPTVTKVVVNMGVGEAARDGKLIDGAGNYTFGVSEQSIFHEIDFDKVDRPRGMDITVVTTAPTNDEGRALLRALGFPYKES